MAHWHGRRRRIDQGTTSTRCILFDHDAQIVAVEQVEHRQLLPQPGWVEHDAAEIWTNTRRVIGGALARAELQARRRRGRSASPTSARRRWSGTARPASRSARRSSGRTPARRPICDELGALDGGAERYRDADRTAAGHLLRRAEGALAARQRRRRAGARRQGELAFGTIDSWLVWNLTGGVDGGLHVTDATNAVAHHADGSGHPAVGRRDRRRDGRAAGDAARDPLVLGGVREGARAAARWPACRSPGILGDQQAATFGQACLEPGEAKNTYGTGNFLLLNTGTEQGAQRERPADDGLLRARRQPPGLRARGVDRGHRLAGAVAARQPRPDLGRRARSRRWRRTVDDNGGAYFVPGVLRPVRARTGAPTPAARSSG